MRVTDAFEREDLSFDLYIQKGQHPLSLPLVDD